MIVISRHLDSYISPLKRGHMSALLAGLCFVESTQTSSLSFEWLSMACDVICRVAQMLHGGPQVRIPRTNERRKMGILLGV